MIQRKQTLWLLLATAAAVLTFMFPFGKGNEINNRDAASIDITPGSNFFILILSIASVAISVITIFFFKDRKLQMKLALLGLVIAIIVFALYILEYSKLYNNDPYLWALFPLSVIVFYFLAYKGIRSDEKLVKSLDKLR